MKLGELLPMTKKGWQKVDTATSVENLLGEIVTSWLEWKNTAAEWEAQRDEKLRVPSVMGVREALEWQSRIAAHEQRKDTLWHDAARMGEAVKRLLEKYVSLPIPDEIWMTFNGYRIQKIVTNCYPEYTSYSVTLESLHNNVRIGGMQIITKTNVS